MNSVAEKSQKDTTLPPEEYAKAMNFIGQNLLVALDQSMQKLPAQLQSNEIAVQGVAAFLSNVIAKQFPNDQDTRKKMADRLSALVNKHIVNM